MTENTVRPQTRSRCSGGGGCVIVEKLAGTFVVRDSKNPYQPGLVFSPQEWDDFLRSMTGHSRVPMVIQIAKAVLLNVVKFKLGFIKAKHG